MIAIVLTACACNLDRPGVALDGDAAPVADPVVSTLEPGDVRLLASEDGATELINLQWSSSGQMWEKQASVSGLTGWSPWAVNAVAPGGGSGELIVIASEDAPAAAVRAVRWDGEAWATDWTSTSYPADRLFLRGFDLAYEQQSSDALVVYDGGASSPMFRTRDSDGWSDEQAVPVIDPEALATIAWIELAAQPGSDQIALVYADLDLKLYAILWDGEAWMPYTRTVLDEALTSLGEKARARAFDVAYEADSGDVMVAWTRDEDGGFAYATWDQVAGAWSAQQFQLLNGTDGSQAHHVEITANPTSDFIAASFYDRVGQNRFSLGMWNGEQWLDADQHKQLEAGAGDWTSELQGQTAWLGQYRAMCVYPNDAAGVLEWALWDSVNGWQVQAAQPFDRLGLTRSIQLVTLGEERVMAAMTDASGGLFTALYDGDAWTVESAPKLTSVIPSMAPFHLTVRP